MTIVTLIGETCAREGFRFVYGGPISECRDCRLKTVCFNLDDDTVYEIIGVRGVHHDCKIHEDGVRVVELKKAPVKTAVESAQAIEGATISPEAEDDECDNIGCQHFILCHPHGLKKGQSYRVKSVIRDIDCPDGIKLAEVEVE